MMAMHTKTLRRTAVLLSILLGTAPPLAAAMVAQDRTFPPGTLTLQRDPNDPSTLLNRFLRTLSTDPRDLSALLGAGRAALAMGDANAAIGFFGRAEAVSPNNGRVKAGLAAAAVQQEQPRQALALFDAAIAAGVPVVEIGKDRGLAHDLRGQGRLAQADYRAALAAAPDDETLRRLALSLAIGGDRATAMTTLDPLLRRQDKAAWRAATFVLAMTGDTGGAIRRANQLMVPTQAAAMTPYLQRLGTLEAGEKAAAVHFGRFPATPGRARTQIATAKPTPSVPPSTAGDSRGLIPGGVALGRPALPVAESSAAALNRRYAAATAAAASSVPARMATSSQPATSATLPVPVAVAAARPAPETPLGEARAPVIAPVIAPVVAAVTVPRATTPALTPPADTVRMTTAATDAAGNAPMMNADTAPAATGPQPAVPGTAPGDAVRTVTAATPDSAVMPAPASVPSPAASTTVVAAVATPARPTPAMILPKASRPSAAPATETAMSGKPSPGATTGAGPGRVQTARPSPVAATPAKDGDVLTVAEKTLLGLRRTRVVTVASLTRGQKATLAAAAARPDGPANTVMLTAAEKALLGIRTRGDVAASTLTRAQKAKLAALPEDDAVMLTAAEKTTLGIKTRGDVAASTLTRAQKAKLAARPDDDVVMLTAAEKTTLGIKTRGDVAASTLTRAQKAKLAARPDDAAVMLTAAEKKTLEIRTRGDVAASTLTRAQKAKLAARPEDAAVMLTAAEKTTLGIRTRGDVAASTLTRAQKAKLAGAGKVGDGATAKAATRERHWVQVAGGANKATLPKAFAGVQKQYPALLSGRTAWTTPLRFTNRLLVGPFASDAEAQAFVNKAGGAGLSAFTYTSPAGVAVEKLPAR